MNIYYVYILFDWLGVPRYVGKGKGRRETSHERHTDPVNWRKNEFIEQTWIMLEEIPKLRVRDGITEVEAFETEIALIKALGRIDRGSGILTNLTDGGDGALAALTPEQCSNRSRRANAALTAEQRSDRARRINAARTFEQRSESAKRGATLFTFDRRSKASKLVWKEHTSEERIQRISHISEGVTKSSAMLTPEQRSNIARYRESKIDPEQRSDRSRRGNASLTPEQRSERARRREATRTPEQRSEKARMANAARWAKVKANA